MVVKQDYYSSLQRNFAVVSWAKKSWVPVFRGTLFSFKIPGKIQNDDTAVHLEAMQWSHRYRAVYKTSTS